MREVAEEWFVVDHLVVLSDRIVERKLFGLKSECALARWSSAPISWRTRTVSCTTAAASMSRAWYFVGVSSSSPETTSLSRGSLSLVPESRRGATFPGASAADLREAVHEGLEKPSSSIEMSTFGQSSHIEDVDDPYGRKGIVHEVPNRLFEFASGPLTRSAF